VQLRGLATIELPAHEGTGAQRAARITSFNQIRFMKWASALSAFIEPTIRQMMKTT
jgi:hypothetical protein